MERWFLAVVSLLVAAGVLAQPVYESRDASGTRVFTDRPSSGGKPVDLKPLNVVEPIPVPPPSPAAPVAADQRQSAPAPAYRSLSIVFPEPGGSVGINTATFEIRVAVDPPLQIANGHAFVFRMDGRNIPGRYTSTENMVPPEFFGDVLPAGSQQHVIEASVVDGQGKVVISATPVSFQTRFFTQLQRPRPLPRPLPAPVAVPPATGSGGSSLVLPPARHVDEPGRLPR